MPFELENSRVIETQQTPKRPAFDLQNSRVLDEKVPMQHTFRESTGKVVAAPYGLTSEEIEYFDDAQNQKGSDFMRGMRMSFEGMPQTTGATLDMAGYISGIKRGGNLPVIRRANDKESMTRPRFGGFAEAWKKGEGLGKLGNIIDQAQEAAGQGVGSSLPAVAGGLAGGAVAGPPGAMVGAILPSAAQMPGEFFLALEDAAAEFNEANPNEPITYDEIASSAALASAPAVLLDAYNPAKVAGGVTKAAKEEAIKKAVQEIIKNIAKETGKSAAREGATEAAQEALKVGTVSAQVKKPLISGENVAQVLEAGAAGAVGGAAIGGGGATVGEGINAVRAPGVQGAAPETQVVEGAQPVDVAGGDTVVADGALNVTPSTSANTPEELRRFADMTQKKITPEELKTAKTKAENDYVMSDAAVESPDPYVEFRDVVENISPEVNDKFQAHGIMTGDVDANLLDLLNNGIDADRGFNSGPPKGGTSGVDSTRNVAPYIILSDSGKSVQETGIKNVVLVGPAAQNIDKLRSRYPDVNFMTSSEAKVFMDSDGAIKPLPAQPAVGGGGNMLPPPPPTGAVPSAAEPSPLSEEEQREADYAKVREIKPPPPPSSLGTFARDLGETLSDWLVPMSTRMGAINERLKIAVRRFTFNVGMYTAEDKKSIQPWVEAVGDKMDEGDFRVLDLALKNGDFAKVDEIMTQYDIADEWQSVRNLLEDIHERAVNAGIKLGKIDNYFPRKVKKGMAPAYINALRGKTDWTLITTAMDKEFGEGVKTLTTEQKADFINLWLRGYKNETVRTLRAGNVKERTVDYVTPENIDFYENSLQALLDYVSSMNYTIETQKLFGKSLEDTDKGVGSYVDDLLQSGIIKPEQEVLVRKILKAVVQPTSSYGALSALKNVSYIYTMGSPISAITQIGDLAFSLHKNGYFQTAFSLAKAATGNAKVTREDVGISDILHEFEDQTKSGKAVRKVFSIVGINRMDKLGKEVLMDGAVSSLQRAAKKNNKDFKERMELMFGAEAAQTTQDLVNGKMSENARFLAYSELLEYQPGSITEYPLSYAEAGNGRIMWMLKSYTIKQVDVYRREIFSKLASGDAKQTVTGLKNLVTLASALMLMGMSADALKDLLLGREIEAEDLLMDNILKTVGFSKYQIYKSQEDGFFRTIFSTLFVPGAMVDDITRDTAALATDEKDIDEVRSVSGIPVIGKFYYWWFGAGKDKE